MNPFSVILGLMSIIFVFVSVAELVGAMLGKGSLQTSATCMVAAYTAAKGSKYFWT